MNIFHIVLYTFPKVLKRKNLFNNQELWWLVITFSILVTFPDEIVRKNYVLVTFWGPKFITLRMNCPHSNLSKVDPQIPDNCIVLFENKDEIG